jgi:hypothetical protein
VRAAHERFVARVEEGRRRAEREEQVAEARLPIGARDDGPTHVEEERLPTTANDLDRCMRGLASELASRDLYFGGVADKLLTAKGWRTLGYASEAQYARERLGMSRAAMREKVTFSRRANALPEIGDAICNGDLGFARASLVARVATPDTATNWIDRAKRRTHKHLREEVELGELEARLLGRAPLPPSEADVEEMRAWERSILSGEIFFQAHEANDNAVQISESADADSASDAASDADSDSDADTDTDTDADTESNPVQISDIPTPPPRFFQRNVESRLRVTEDLALFYRQVEEHHRRLGSPCGSFVKFLCAVFFSTWAAHLGKSDKWELVYRRDLYRCSSPVCDRRECTLHHVTYRSKGGTDEPEGTTSGCPFCHLLGEHEHRLKVIGKAPDQLTWWIGRIPILEVRGRELVWAA